MSVSAIKRDTGITVLLDGKRVSKCHLRLETYGTLDELNSFLGMARAVIRDKTIKKILFTIQNHFFIIGSDLALSGRNRGILKGEISQKEVDWLVELTRDFRTLVKPNPKFIIYGATLISGILDVARAVSRRTERQVARMKSKRMLTNFKILEYLNCLSDLLYFIARYEEKKAKVKPRHPTYNLSIQDRDHSAFGWEEAQLHAAYFKHVKHK